VGVNKQGARTLVLSGYQKRDDFDTLVSDGSPQQEAKILQQVLADIGRMSAELQAVSTSVQRIEARLEQREERDRESHALTTRHNIEIETLRRDLASETAARIALQGDVKRQDERVDELAIKQASGKKWTIGGIGGTAILGVLWALLQAFGVIPQGTPAPNIQQPPGQTAPAQPAATQPQEGVP